MAETRETFTIVEDTDGEGQALLARTDGGQLASAGNHMGVLAFKSNAGNDVKPTLNVDGTLPVSFNAGTPDSASGFVALAALNTEEDVVAITVAVNDVCQANMAMGSAFQDMVWVLYHDDDGSLNELARFATGAGDFSHSTELANIQFTAGATGTQRMVLRATQLRGKLTNAHGTISLSVAP